MPDNPFAAWLRGRRAEKRQTQEQLGEILGRSVHTIRRWEAGTIRPRKVDDVHALARWADVPPSAVLGLCRRTIPPEAAA